MKRTTFLSVFSLLIIFLFSKPLFADSLSQLLNEAESKSLSNHSYWHRLLHYNKNILGKKRSDIDTTPFFLSSDGQTDAMAELKATLSAYFDPVTDPNTHVTCRYPARFDWLREQLNTPFNPPEEGCPRYESWRAKLEPEDVSMVFASYYLNNPASTYGHTFLKLKRKGTEVSEGLLDYTINFAADTNTNNGVMFALRGLMGGYRGRFSTVPYYIKIQQYNNMESRDLWEYDLRLSPDAIDRLVKHLWELGPAAMPYFFFNKNCSYQLLPLLDVADPERSFSSEFQWRVIPLDTLRSITKEKGFIESCRLRPSHVRTMLAYRNELNSVETKLAEDLVSKNHDQAMEVIPTLSKDRQFAVLTSAHHYLRYRYGFYRDQPESFQEKERTILLHQKNLPTQHDDRIIISAGEPPDQGHQSTQVRLGFGWDRTSAFQEYAIRASLHDLEAKPVGFIPGSQLEMIHLKFRHDNARNKIYLENFSAVDIVSLSPWDRWVHPRSWRVHMGIETLHGFEGDPEDRLTGNLNGGSGYTSKIPFSHPLLFYVLWKGEGAIGDFFRDDYRAGIGGMGGLLLSGNSPLRIHVWASAMRFGMGDNSNEVRMQLVNSFNMSLNTEIRLAGERRNGHREGMLSFVFYL